MMKITLYYIEKRKYYSFGLNCKYQNMSLPTVCFVIGAPIDGDFGDWEAWGQCSHTCGESFSSRTRKCDNPAPQNGGRDCDVRWSTENIKCTVTNCPGMSIIQNVI